MGVYSQVTYHGATLDNLTRAPDDRRCSSGWYSPPSPLFTRLRSLTRRDGDWGGLLLCLLPTVSLCVCVWEGFWSDLSHCPAAPCLGPMRSLYVWLGRVSAEVADSFSPAVNHPSFLNVTIPLSPCAPMF